MDQSSALNAFCRMVEAGGFSTAAAQLNLSPKVRAFIDFATEVYQSPRWA